MPIKETFSTSNYNPYKASQQQQSTVSSQRKTKSSGYGQQPVIYKKRSKSAGNSLNTSKITNKSTKSSNSSYNSLNTNLLEKYQHILNQTSHDKRIQSAKSQPSPYSRNNIKHLQYGKNLQKTKKNQRTIKSANLAKQNKQQLKRIYNAKSTVSRGGVPSDNKSSQYKKNFIRENIKNIQRSKQKQQQEQELEQNQQEQQQLQNQQQQTQQEQKQQQELELEQLKQQEQKQQEQKQQEQEQQQLQNQQQQTQQEQEQKQQEQELKQQEQQQLQNQQQQTQQELEQLKQQEQEQELKQQELKQQELKQQTTKICNILNNVMVAVLKKAESIEKTFKVENDAISRNAILANNNITTYMKNNSVKVNGEKKKIKLNQLTVGQAITVAQTNSPKLQANDMPHELQRQTISSCYTTCPSGDKDKDNKNIKIDEAKVKTFIEI